MLQSPREGRGLLERASQASRSAHFESGDHGHGESEEADLKKQANKTKDWPRRNASRSSSDLPVLPQHVVEQGKAASRDNKHAGAARCSAMQRMLRGQRAGSHQASEANRVKNMASNPALEALIPMSCGMLGLLQRLMAARRTDATSEGSIRACARIHPRTRQDCNFATAGPRDPGHVLMCRRERKCKCAVKRAHKCQFCLSPPQRDDACPLK